MSNLYKYVILDNYHCFDKAEYVMERTREEMLHTYKKTAVITN
jgi:hypothetical protein